MYHKIHLRVYIYIYIYIHIYLFIYSFIYAHHTYIYTQRSSSGYVICSVWGFGLLTLVAWRTAGGGGGGGDGAQRTLDPKLADLGFLWFWGLGLGV